MYHKNFEHLKYLISNNNELVRRRIDDISTSDLVHPHTAFSLNRWNGNYTSIFHPICLYKINSLDRFSGNNFFLVRDGLFLLMDFFNRVKKTPEFRSILLIHNCLRDFVPEEWMSNVVFFEYEYRPSVNNFTFNTIKKKKKLVVKIDFLKKLFSIEKVNSTLIGYNEKLSEIIFCFAQHERNHFLDNTRDSGQFINECFEHVATLKRTALEVSEKVTLGTFKDLQSLKNINDCLYYDLSFLEHYFIDDYNNYSCLSNGMIPYTEDNLTAMSPDDFYVRLSRNYGITLISNSSKKDNSKLKKMDYGFRQLGILPYQKLTTPAFQLIESLSLEIKGTSRVKKNCSFPASLP